MNEGFATLAKSKNSELIITHCLLHREALMVNSHLIIVITLSDMQPSTKPQDVHWICGSHPVDAKGKLNLAEFYKAGINSAEPEKDVPLRSCSDDTSPGRLSFEQKGPYVYQLYTPLEQETRCLALDLFFKEPVTVARICFQNHYVAYLSVLAKIVNHRNWQTLIQHRQLMPYPHYETGSRSYFQLEPETGAWTDVTEIRFMLHQPSPCWKRVFIENVSVYREQDEAASKDYLTELIQRTSAALKMEKKNDRKPSTTSGNIPFQIGTSGYRITKLAHF